MFKILTNILVIYLLNSIAGASEPYCQHNETIITRTPVTKTRQVIKKPTGPFKIFKKTKIFTEEFQDFEEHVQFKLVRKCCDGYMKSRFDICEPVCANGCPMNARCVEPNLCQCQRGYISAVSTKNGSHYCEPICNGGCPPNARCAEPDICECERGYHTVDDRCEPRCTSKCPFGGSCVLPDKCHCLEGYKAEAGTCMPICTIGDGCLNGRCVDSEKCICNKGYTMNSESKICEKSCFDDVCDDDYASVSEFSTTTTMPVDTSDEEEINDDSSELDQGEKIFLTPPTDYTDETDYSDVPDSTMRYSKCPQNYIFYEKICRPQVFTSNEVDCRFKPCVENAICQSNGTCACIEGYDWYKPYENTELATEQEKSSVCLTLAEISANLNGARLAENDAQDDTDWLSACFITLGVLCMVGALCFLAVKILRHRNGEMDVEAKNDLYCTYDSKNSRDIPHVL